MCEERLIRGGSVVSEQGIEPGDVLVRGETIAFVGRDLAVSTGAEVLDARDCWVFPGFIDLHVHVGERIGGYDLADDFESATRLALENGITCLGVFAHQASGSLEDALDALLCQARSKAHCDFIVHLAPTRFDAAMLGEVRRLAARGARSLKLYTTYREAGLFADAAAISTVLTLAAELDLRVLVHCEDDSIVAADPQRPVDAEVRAIESLVQAAQQSGARVHIVHVSSPQGLATAQPGRCTGQVTVETCPQYLCFDERHHTGPQGHRYLCSPPLRSAQQRAALVTAVASNQVDVLATDHCPFTGFDKDRFAANRASVPRGLPGLGALVPIAFELFESSLRPAGLVQLLSSGPARVAGLFPRKGAVKPGCDADLAVLRLPGPRKLVRSTLGQAHDPYANKTTSLEVRHVLSRGRCVVREGKWRGESCHGRLAWQT